MPALDLSFLDSLDPNTPDSVMPDGTRVWTVQHCRLAFRGMPAPSIPGDGGFDVLDVATLDVATRNLYNDEVEPEVQAEDEPDAVDAQPAKGVLVKGISSSTSVDFYGTEMSERALKMMAAQMGGGDGIPYLPRHNNGLSGPIEWDGAIGRTVHAEVVPTEAVKSAHDPTESQFLLGTTIRLVPIPDKPFSELDQSEKDAASLLKRTGRGEPIGQSIGGWFTSLQVMTDDEDNVVRIIVLGVDLDHLAVTRAPANPDATGISQLRSKVQERMATRTRARTPMQVRSMATGEPVPAVATIEDGMPLPIAVVETERTVMCQYAKLDSAEPSGAEMIGPRSKWTEPDSVKERHIISAAETNGTVVYQYLKAGMDPGDVPDDELVGGRIGGEETEDRDTTDKYDGDDDDGAREPGPDETSQEFATEQTIEPMCAKSDVGRGRVSVSWDEDPTPEAVRTAVQAIKRGDLGPEVQTAFEEAVRSVEQPAPAPAALDTPAPAEQSTDEAPDARGSAPPVPVTTTPPPDKVSEASTETDMPSLEELSALLDSKLEPLTVRVAGLESGSSAAPAPTIEQQLAASQEETRRAQIRLDRVLQEPARHGNVQSGQYTAGTPEAEEGISLAITRAKQGGQCRATSVVAERLAPLINSKRPAKDGVLLDVGDVKEDLENGLRSFYRAAAADGIFREGQLGPFNRALDSAGTGSILVQNITNPVVQQIHLRELGVSTTLPRKPGQGTKATLPNRTPGAGGEWVNDTDTFTGGVEGTYDAPEFLFKTHGLTGKVTRFLQATGRSYGDILGNEVIALTGDWSVTYEQGVLLGDIAVDPKQFDGLFTLIGAVGTQVIAQTSAAAGDALTLGKIDKTFDAIKGGGNSADIIIYANKFGRRKLAALLQAQQLFGDATVIGAGFRVRTYDGAPIVTAEEIPKTMAWSGTAITDYTTGATTAILIVNKRYVWIEELTTLSVAPNASGTSQFSSFDIYSDSVAVLANPLGAAILGGIKVDDN